MSEAQKTFLKLLIELTEAKVLEWVRSKVEVGFVYCLAGEELIVFELGRGSEDVLADPEEDISGILSKCRNISYLWVEVTPGFDELLSLLKSAKMDDQLFAEARRRCYKAPVIALEALKRSLS